MKMILCTCSRDDRPQTMVITRNETPGSTVDEIGGGGQLTTFIYLHSFCGPENQVNCDAISRVNKS